VLYVLSLLAYEKVVQKAYIKRHFYTMIKVGSLEFEFLTIYVNVKELLLSVIVITLY
jgi:hypothetical protein